MKFKIKTPLPRDNSVFLITMLGDHVLIEEIALTPSEIAWFKRVAELLSRDTIMESQQSVGALAQ
jgi:hypothetical protein